MVKRTARCAGALGVLLGAMVIGLAACGGSSNGGSGGTAKAGFALSGMKMGHAHGAMPSMPGMDMSGSSASKMKMAGAGDAYGVAFLRQAGDRLTGWVAAWGLAPGSRHAEHVHGPDGACAPPSKQTMNMAVVLPDLQANAQGVAFNRIALTVHQQVVRPGFFVMVHRDPTPPAERDQIGSAPASAAFMRSFANNPMVLCGDVEAK
jgi:hypothetical protein